VPSSRAALRAGISICKTWWAFALADRGRRLPGFEAEALRLSRSTRVAADSYFVRAESVDNLATEIERLDPQLIESYGGRSLHEQSHGES